MNPSTRRYVLIIMAAMVLGAMIGLSSGLTLSLIPIPGYSDMPLTLDERASLERLAGMLGLLSGRFGCLDTGSMFLFFLAGVLLLKVLNPHAWTRGAFSSWTGRLKLLIVIVISAGSVFAASELMSLDLKGFFIFVGLFAFFWFIAGEQGWAGDFSSWKMRREEGARPLLSLALGAGFGIMVWVLHLTMLMAAEGLFSDVFSGSQAARLLPEKHIRTLAFFSLEMALSFGISFGLAAALAPVNIETGMRRKRFIFSMVLLAVSLAFLYVPYQEGRQSYAVFKEGIVKQAGLSSESVAYSAIVFRADDDRHRKLQEVTNTVMNFFGIGESIPVSKENAELIEKYIQENINTMPFIPSVMMTRTEMLYKLWRPVEARESYFSDIYFDITPRQMLFSQLHRGVPAAEAGRYLEEFSNESKWSLGKHYTYSLAHAFAHYGHPEKALRWKEKAQEMGADVSKLDIPATPPLLGGVVTGRISSEALDLKGTRLGLFWLWEGNNYNITGISEYGPTDLMQAVELGPDGTFAFNEVYEGAYHLALNLETSRLPGGVSNETIRLLNSPGAFFINTTNPEADLGTIEIRFETQKP